MVRLLFIPRERFPTFRVDVDVLFGRELSRRGHKIDLVMQAENGSQPTGKHTWYSGTVFVGPTDAGAGLYSKLRKHWRAFSHDLHSLRLARKEDYDAIQVKDKFLIAVIALAIARQRGLRFFYWLSFPIPESQLLLAKEPGSRHALAKYIRGRVFGWLLYKWILPHSNHVFVQSERMRDDVCARSGHRENVTPIPMGVDAQDMALSTSSQQQRRAGQEYTIGYLGTLATVRRLEILVDILADLRRRGANARLLIVGDGNTPDERASIERRAEKLGLRQYLEVTGYLPRLQALEKISTADVCLSPFFPSPILDSTSPTKLVEYLALGLPVVANDHPEQRFVLKSCKAGICVPWGARHFARAAMYLLNQTDDARTAMGLRGRNWVLAHRTYSRIADDLEAVYARLVPKAAIPLRVEGLFR